MDRAIWALWYELPVDGREDYLAWFHGVHIPEKLARPGYLWAAHYVLDKGSERYHRATAGRRYANDAGLGRGRGYLALFGGVHAHTFLDPSPGQLKARQDDETRRLIGFRREPYTCVLSEEARVDGPQAATRRPGITPAPVIRFDSYNAASLAAEDEAGAWHAQERFPALATMPGCVGARSLLASLGWGRHATLVEFASRDAWEQGFVAHEEALHAPGTRGAALLEQVTHAPCSTMVGARIWPA
jgi:hypothetical protein